MAENAKRPEQRPGARSLQQEEGEPQGMEADEQQVASPEAEPLVSPEEASELRSRWSTIQTQFVDDPRRAVEDANNLVDEVTKHIVETFTRGRADLEEQWSRGDDVTTEELRVVLQRYRSFFDGLLRTGKSSP
jgi:hypothetical protein